MRSTTQFDPIGQVIKVNNKILTWKELFLLIDENNTIDKSDKKATILNTINTINVILDKYSTLRERLMEEWYIVHIFLNNMDKSDDKIDFKYEYKDREARFVSTNRVVYYYLAFSTSDMWKNVDVDLKRRQRINKLLNN